MTRKTDLTAEQLDELHASVFRETQRVPHKATYGITLGDCLALIAMARDKQAAVRERDALRALLTGAIAWAEDGPDGCFSCVPDDAPEGKRHQGWCWVHSAVTALAQHTDAEGTDD